MMLNVMVLEDCSKSSQINQSFTTFQMTFMSFVH